MVAGKILGVTAALSAVSQYCTLGEKIEDTSQGTCRTSAGLRTITIIATGVDIVKLRQGSGKDRQGMAVKAKGLKA